MVPVAEDLLRHPTEVPKASRMSQPEVKLGLSWPSPSGGKKLPRIVSVRGKGKRPRILGRYHFPGPIASRHALYLDLDCSPQEIPLD